MPKYKVLKSGFHDGIMHHPVNEGKRNFVNTDKPLKPVPSWLEKVKSETASEKKKRTAAEKKQAEADKEKADTDQSDIDDVTFLGDDAGTSSTVETL